MDELTKNLDKTLDIEEWDDITDKLLFCDTPKSGVCYWINLNGKEYKLENGRVWRKK